MSISFTSRVMLISNRFGKARAAYSIKRQVWGRQVWGGYSCLESMCEGKFEFYVDQMCGGLAACLGCCLLHLGITSRST